MFHRVIKKDQYGDKVSFRDGENIRNKIYDTLIEWYLAHDTLGDAIYQDERSTLHAIDVVAHIADEILCFKMEEELEKKDEQ